MFIQKSKYMWGHDYVMIIVKQPFGFGWLKSLFNYHYFITQAEIEYILKNNKGWCVHFKLKSKHVSPLIG